MRSPRRLLVPVAAVAAVALVVAPGAPAGADSPVPPAELVSRLPSGAAAQQSTIGPGRTDPHSVSADGRYVAVTTPDGGPGDTNATADVYVRDRVTGTSELVTVGMGGAAAALGGRVPSISGDGRYVAFVSESPDITAGDSGASGDVFVRDRARGTTRRVSVNGTTRFPGNVVTAQISAVGDHVAWVGNQGVFVAQGVTRPAGSVFARIIPDAPAAYEVAISGDGAFFLFIDSAGRVRRHRVATGASEVVSNAVDHTYVTGRQANISYDGTVVSFTSDDPFAGGVQGVTGLYLRRIPTFGAPSTEVVYRSATVQASTLSTDGRWVAFATTGGIAADDTDQQTDVYTWNDVTRSPTLVSGGLAPTPSTAPGRPAWTPEISGDGAVTTLVSSTAGPGAPAGTPRRWAVASTPRPADRWRDSVDLVYRSVRGRDPDAAERADGVALLSTLRGTDGTLARDVVRGAGWAEPRALVVRLYEAYFLRPPELTGYDYWLGRRLAGVTPDRISASFAGSAEFRTRYGALSDREFVDLVYVNVLGRLPDTAGSDYWTDQLAGRRRSRGQVMTAFSESAENRARTQDRVDVILVGAGRRSIPTDDTMDALQTRWAKGLPPTSTLLAAVTLPTGG